MADTWPSVGIRASNADDGMIHYHTDVVTVVRPFRIDRTTASSNR
ncbi:hypothetical protein HSR122_1872 [Halapricum desulfuricans]|uniref:Uncharacterized protein n=1 Tax=Halapricum desulfuricans TaxID=2841257 RepID=A0A897N992_9EURY|nr:hypothetical protein HSR122_1872 [Halapricum desulfuricans]